MQLISLGIKGFMGASFERGLCLENMGRVNLLIGPNNAGKSIPYRAMQIVHLVARDAAGYTPSAGSAALELSSNQSWFKEQSKLPLQFNLVLKYDASDIDQLKIEPSCAHFKTRKELGTTIDIEVLVWKTNVISALISPMTRRNNENLREIKFSSSDRTYSYLTGNVKSTNYEGSPASEECSQNARNDAVRLLRSATNTFSFVASSRDLGRNRTEQRLKLIDGSSVTDTIISHQEAADQEIRAKLDYILAQINSVLSLTGPNKFCEFHVARGADRTISIVDGRNFRFKLSSLGSGIEALVILLTEIMLEPRPCIYFIEEPEHHMHPGLSARFIQFLKSSCSQHQFVISTHSHTLLDGLDSNDRVYRFSKTADGECIADQCKEFTDYHRTLDLLGVRASSLLQVNSVIWVEGPSDIEYLRGWMEAIGDADPSKRLVENSDYAFVIYGGSNIAHLTAGDLDGGESNQIHMLKICRRAALVADKDGGERAELKDHVRRLKGEFKRHAAARVFTTQNREIENELPSEVLRQALKATFPDKLKEFPLDSFTPTNDDRIPAQIQALKPGRKLGTKKNEWDALYNQRKTRLAAKAVEIIKAGRYPSPPYIAELVDFILEGREPEKAEGSKLQNADGAG
ncbi:MAG: ATP-binding protein [Candidatus Melainabacteria bacterium]|nr:ATP-binding protein [Candidatus Melainabacteria bacterium]